MDAVFILGGAVRKAFIGALLHILMALGAFADAFAQLVVAFNVPVVLGLGAYGEAAPAFGGGYGAPRRAGFVAVFLGHTGKPGHV